MLSLVGGESGDCGQILEIYSCKEEGKLLKTAVVEESRVKGESRVIGESRVEEEYRVKGESRVNHTHGKIPEQYGIRKRTHPACGPQSRC